MNQLGDVTDHERVRAVFLAERHEIMAYVLGLVRDPHDAEDVLQEVWLALEDRLRGEDPIRNIQAYCMIIARNAVYRLWRTRRRDSPMDASIMELLSDDVPRPEEDWTEHLVALRGCLGQLQAGARQLLEWRYVEGHGNDELAHRAGLGAEACAMRLMRLRQSLRRCVDRRMAAVEDV